MRCQSSFRRRYDHGLLLVSQAEDDQLSWVTRVFIAILGGIFLGAGWPLFSEPEPGAFGIFLYGTALFLSALNFYWAIRGTLTTMSSRRLVKMAPVFALAGCAVKVLSGVMLVVLLVYWGFGEVFGFLGK